MGIRNGVKDWLMREGRSVKEKITLVFHTSCVRFQDDDLEYLEKTGLPWCVPDNVRVELALLVQNGREYGANTFSRRAQRILDNARAWELQGCIGASDPWDLEQLYIDQGKRFSMDRELFAGMSLLFLFGDRYKMYEFLEHSRDLRGHHVLVLKEEEWACSGGRVASLEKEHGKLRSWARGFWSGRECTGVDLRQRSCTAEELRRVKSYDCRGHSRPGGLGIPIRMLGEQLGKGTYAVICRSNHALSGDMVKVFMEWDMTGNGVGKIRSLMSGAEGVAHLPLAMPQRMLMSSDWPNRVLGYTMKELEGSPANGIALRGDWPDEVEPGLILRRIGALLVEVHVRSMLVNDLSYHNVLVSDRGRVGFVDCDSFQSREYVGGPMTPIYRHRDLTEEDCEKRLRKPIHEYFSFTVLLYQLIMGVIDPLNMVKQEIGIPRTWSNTSFPLDWDTRSSDNVGKEILQRWVKQDETTRRLFADVFHFRRSPSIGAILRDLGLV